MMAVTWRKDSIKFVSEKQSECGMSAEDVDGTVEWCACCDDGGGISPPPPQASQTLNLESPCILPKPDRRLSSPGTSSCAGDISHDNARLLSKSAHALGPCASSAVCGSLPVRARLCRRPY